ncbi:major facilitator superfamily domain-containing protein [Desarmillaria ectypa]|nr:major facilitator superfamily domain-containing protein [Desarmillaria ectypa]
MYRYGPRHFLRLDRWPSHQLHLKCRIFRYANQRPDFEVPSHFLLPSSQRPSTIVSLESDATTLCGDLEKSRGTEVQLTRESTLAVDLDAEKQKRIDAAPSSDPYIVGWYGDDDQDNPRNWSSAKRALVAFSISFLTFSVYIGSAIHTPSIHGLMTDFNVPLLSVSCSYGRNPVYIATLLRFVVFQILVVVARNMGTVLTFRFFTGFVGSSALAAGGASTADIYPMHHFAYVLGIWALGAVAGPIAGPLSKGSQHRLTDGDSLSTSSSGSPVLHSLSSSYFFLRLMSQ